MLSTPMHRDLLLLRQLIPPLTARTADGSDRPRLGLQTRNATLVIAFLHSDCAAMRRRGWNSFAARAADLAEREAVGLL